MMYLTTILGAECRVIVFLTNLDSVYSTMMATSVSGGIIVNMCYQNAFSIVIQAHHLE